MALPPVARDGDSGSHGGTISAITTRTYVNGRLVLTVGAVYHCPIPEHGPNPVVAGSPSHNAEGMAVARVGDPTACGAVVSSGSPDTFSG